MRDVEEPAAPRASAAEVAAFIARWEPSGGAELANYALFLTELCDLLRLDRPEPARADTHLNDYVFERQVVIPGVGETTTGRIDLYKRGCFVLEAKQGVQQQIAAERALRPFAAAAAAEAPPRRQKGAGTRGGREWSDAMLRARGQAHAYARAIAAETGECPPFMIVADVGHSIELYADFSRTGNHYTQFPDGRSFRLTLADLHDPAVQHRLAAVWTAPASLDPSRRAEAVTRHVGRMLAALARSLEKDGNEPRRVSEFLMRCVFTMFAEDVGLLKPADCFRDFLVAHIDDPATFRPMLEDLWRAMDKGGFSAVIKRKVAHFNGGLFRNSRALALTAQQIRLLARAARADWTAVEPAIFGTILERALEPRERHKLGAHYTPRPYVERLVIPTVIEPLRREWDAVKAAALLLAGDGDLPKAQAEALAFHTRLCAVRVLDPACGSGNFLYVALEHMKRLEGEVLDLLEELGQSQYLLELDRHTVDPHQFLGIEKNPRAVAAAELVLWIGYLQWHFRTRGRTQPAEPVLRNFRNIVEGDALLTWTREEPRRDDAGRPLTRWDGETRRLDPVTGHWVPDTGARVPLTRLIEPRPTDWPEADFIVGNPPFLGGKDIRDTLGEGYAEALWSVYSDLPQSIDYVMYWWHKAADLVRRGPVRRFGFITTNSLPQTFSRRVVQMHMTGRRALSLLFAIPDHPWVDAADGAAVRIAMTIAAAGRHDGRLLRVTAESGGDGEGRRVELDERTGRINADLTIGADVSKALPLMANDWLCSPGVKLHGKGFIVTPTKAGELGLGKVKGLEKHIRPYLNGRDLTGRSRGVMVIDLHGLSEVQVRQRFPAVYQHVLETVKPERDLNNEEYRRTNWWLFGRKNTDLRTAIAGLSRYIATVETSRFRTFVFLPVGVRPDNMLVCVALDDAYHLGVLSSRIHVVWALAAGARLGVGNDPRYSKSNCFDKFPFPLPAPDIAQEIRALAEELDAHRKARQAEHPDLTLTQMYNVLEKMRAERPLDEAERRIKDRGLITVLRHLHDRLDALVFQAYGWPATLADGDVLARLVALNRQRALEERQRNVVHWLRPDYQKQRAGLVPRKAPARAPDSGRDLDVTLAEADEKPAWPRSLPERARLLRDLLAGQDRPLTAAEVNRLFAKARKEREQRVAEVLETLVKLSQARSLEGGRYAGR
ncbi:class I SAM-dependent DNA methyltransferase [Caenispirillum bisanense]|uniref:class I SAM-dependent DNA methyltransferase n=1 Tax=Caenispirillum bisanense TaxID=414052 RepID=UPI0031D607C5